MIRVKVNPGACGMTTNLSIEGAENGDERRFARKTSAYRLKENNKTRLIFEPGFYGFYYKRLLSFSSRTF